MAKLSRQTFLRLLRIAGPLVLSRVPGASRIAPVLPILIDAIAAAEQLPGAPTGQIKKAHALGTVVRRVEALGTLRQPQIPPSELAGQIDRSLEIVLGVVRLLEQLPPAQAEPIAQQMIAALEPGTVSDPAV